MNEDNQGDSRPVPDPTVLTTELTHREITHLRELMEQKLSKVDLQFVLVERQRLELKTDSQKKVDDAFTAATTAIAATAKTIDDVKERVGAIENLKQGGREQVTGIYAFVGFLLTLLLIGGAVAAIIATR